MKRLAVLLGAGALIVNTAVAQGSTFMPANPFGTMFAPWNSLPGGFSPLNNGFTSGGPMGMSPFAMSPFGSNGSPWGGMPSGAMPWNAWQSGSVMPWANQMPFGANNGSGMPMMPWGGNNNWGNSMPWGNGFNPWSSWMGNNTSYRRDQDRDTRYNRDALRTLLLMQELNNNSNTSGLFPGLSGLPPLSGSGLSMPSIPAAPVLSAPLSSAATPNRTPAPVPTQPIQGGFTVPSPPRQFNPFSIPPAQPQQPAVPMQPVTPQRPNQRFTNPFSDPLPAEAATTTNRSNTGTSSFNPFAIDNVQPHTDPMHGLQFPDENLF